MALVNLEPGEFAYLYGDGAVFKCRADILRTSDTVRTMLLRGEPTVIEPQGEDPVSLRNHRLALLRHQFERERPEPPLQEVSTQPLYNYRNEIIAQIPQRPEPAGTAARDYVAFTLPAGTVVPTSILRGDTYTIPLPPTDAPLPDRGAADNITITSSGGAIMADNRGRMTWSPEELHRMGLQALRTVPDGYAPEFTPPQPKPGKPEEPAIRRILRIEKHAAVD